MSLTTFQILSLVLLIVLIFAFTKLIFLPYLCYKKYCKLLTSLKYKTFIHPFIPLGSNIRKMMKADSLKYGDPVRSFKVIYPNFEVCMGNIFNEPVMEIIKPQLIKQFYKNANEMNYIKADVITGAFSLILENGLLLAQGQKWKNRKKIISSVFHYDFITTLIPQIQQICLRRMTQMQECNSCIQSKKQFKLNIHQLFQSIFSQVIVRCFFGAEPKQTIQGKSMYVFINALIADIAAQARSLPHFLFGNIVISSKLKKDLAMFKQFAKELIQKRLEEIQSQKVKSDDKPKDIIEALYNSNQFCKSKKNKTDSNTYDFDDLIGEFCTFFIAGMDTTSNFMASLIYVIAKKQNIQIQQSIRRQIQNIASDITKKLTLDILKKFSYVQNTQKQTLRMFSPVTGMFFRKAIKQHYIGDILIQKGMTVVVRNRCNNYNQKHFQNPFKFDPQRWNKPQDQLHPFAFLPFSSGNRTCIGNHLSLLQSKIVLIMFLRRYKVIQLQKQDYKMQNKFLYSPEKMITTLRSQICNDVRQQAQKMQQKYEGKQELKCQ